MYPGLFLTAVLMGSRLATAETTVIIDEQFLGNSEEYYTARGWFDGTTSLNQALILEFDPTLNKQVIYAKWSNPGEPNPSGGNISAANSWRYMINRDNPSIGWPRGVSFWAAVKFTNYIDVPGSRLGHGMFRMMQHIAGPTAPLNDNGAILIDPQRGNNTSYWYLGEPSASQQCSYNPQLYVGNDHNYSIAWVGPERHIMDSCQNGWLHDDIWYEIAGFIFPSVEVGQSSNTGKVKLYYRLHGTQDWVRLLNSAGLNMITGNPGVINQVTCCGPYSHLPEFTSPAQRMYLGWLTYYHGDAIADGLIPGFTDGGVGE